MCWEKEDEYKGMCFDHVWGLNVDDGVKDILGYAGVEIVNPDKAKTDFFALLSLWHNEGVIRPQK